MIMSAIVCYVLPGLIGRAYDLKNETVGPDLFDVNVTKNARVIERYMTTAEYRVVTDEADAKDFLDVNGKVALKVKTGRFDIGGSGSYLKQASSFKNRVDLLVKVHYETVIVTLPSDAKPLPDWKNILKAEGDTHYIRSIKYGGDLITSLSFITTNEADTERIKGDMQVELTSKSGSFGGGIKGNLDKIMNRTKNSASMSINYYATVPLDSVPRTIQDLVDLVDKFPNQAKKVNNGWGVPLEMEVFSLEGISKDIKTYFQTMAFHQMMNTLSEQFTDIKTARRRLSDWMHSIPPLLSDEMKYKISNFSSKLDEISTVFSEVIANIDLSSDASPAQFDIAFNAYKGDEEESYPDMYLIKLSNLKVEIMASHEVSESDFGGAIYTYWGRNNCTSSSDLVTSGIMYSTVKNSIGSSRFFCLPEKRDYIQSTISPIGDEHIQDLPQILPVLYKSIKKEETDGKVYNMDCSSCRLPGKTSVIMLPGKSTCPSGWSVEYEGVLVSTRIIYTRSELICLDANKYREASDDNIHPIVVEVSASCNDFPCSSTGITEDKGLACVVCSMKKHTTSKSKFYGRL